MDNEKLRNKILNHNIISVDDLIWLIDNGYISKDLIGKKVYIYNSFCKTQTWIIIGINHDKTKNTIDLISESLVMDNIIFSISSNKYDKSNIRKKINKLIDGFDISIQDYLMNMDIKTDNYINNDKIKILSMTELGLEDYHSDIVKYEGEPYEYDIIRLFENKDKYIYYPTRSRKNDKYNNCIWIIWFDKSIEYASTECIFPILPVIRLGKKEN